MTFNVLNGKTEYMVIGSNRAEEESLTNEVKNGKIERVKEHKTLGTWLDESGEYSINTKKRREKLSFMINTTRREAHPKDLGIYAAEARLKLAEVVVISSIIDSSEAFPTYKEKEIQELEQIQLTILTGILEMPCSTPYYTLLMETGWWTMRARMDYKKLMLYHNIQRSDEKRVIKKVLDVQRKENRSTTWYNSVQELKKIYNITLIAELSSKSQWKKHVKTRINTEVEKVVRGKCCTMSKGRTVKHDAFEKKEYFTKVCFSTTKKILKYRTHMTVIPGNYKGKTEGTCLLCGVEKGTSEHYFGCAETRYIAGAWEVRREDLQSNEIKKMTNVANFMEKVELLMNPLLMNDTNN